MTLETEIRYVVNPDVSCREEGADGALLFNPDTDKVLVVNPTGLLIWRALEEPRRLAEVVTVLEAQCRDVPMEQVQDDVREFVAHLQASGFVGVVEEPRE
jgi:sensor domain CHASE-containing protein